MTIRFAAAHTDRKSFHYRLRCRSVALDAVNDNRREPFGNPLVGIALRHFAHHGLAAADCARTRAEAAAQAGDAAAFQWWIGIYRQFDRRGAEALARRTPPFD